MSSFQHEAVYTLIPGGAKTTTYTGSSFRVDIFNAAVAFLNVVAASGTSPTLNVKLQDSWDGVEWYDTGVAFTQATGVTTERKTISNFGRFIRAVGTIAGTSPSFTFGLNVVFKGNL